MALFNVKFEVLSPITSIPNSQTIFGTICTYYASMYGESELEEILSKMEQKDYPFVVSSMFFENTLPLPLNFIPRCDSEKLSYEKVKLLKGIKKLKYISKKVYLKANKNIEQLNLKVLDLLDKKDICIENNILMLSEEKDKLNLKVNNSMRTRVNVEDEQYFNNSLLFMPKNTNLEFYIEINSNVMVDKLKKLLKSMEYVSFGGGKSVGYNLFAFISIDEENELKSEHPSLLLSLAVGDDTIVYDKSDYKLITINNKFNYASETINRCGALCFVEGSVISTSSNTIGFVVKEEINSRPTYQNFVGLLI